MSLASTILVFAVIPLGIYGLLALLTLRGKTARAARYRPGQEWPHQPVWWVANPDGVGSAHPAAMTASAASTDAPTAKGGAHGTW